MPRQSMESRAAEAWRGKAAPPAVPASLSPAAAAMWLTIVNDRPVDYFRPGALELLELYCATVVAARETLDASHDDPKLLTNLTKLILAANQLAGKLRLSPAAYIPSVSRKQDEGGLPQDPLLGGHARRS